MGLGTVLAGENKQTASLYESPGGLDQFKAPEREKKDLPGILAPLKPLIVSK